MGVFNRLGSISKLPIRYNDEVYCYIGIRTNVDTYGNPFAHLIPIHFPIIGRYDDYGSIMDIEESEITKNLCKLFQCNDIEALFKEVYKNETFQDNIFDNKIMNISKIEEYISKLEYVKEWTLGLFMEHKWYYDYLSSYSLDNSKSINKTRITDEYLTDYFGFTKQDDGCTFTYGNRLKITKEVKNDNWNNYFIYNEAKHKNIPIYHLGYLGKFSKEYYGVDLIPIRPMTNTEYRYMGLLNELEKIRENNELFQDNINEFIDFIYCLYQRESYPVVKYADNIELLQKNKWFINIQRDMDDFLFPFEDLPLTYNPIFDLLIGKPKEIYESFFKSDLKNGVYPKYFKEYIALRELFDVLYYLNWNVEQSEHAGQDTYVNTLLDIKQKEMNYLKKLSH